jgi:hypothetical protein
MLPKLTYHAATGPSTGSDCGSVTVSEISPPPVWTCTTGTVSRLDYGNNEDMAGIIAPTGATSITLTFTVFNTELNYDKLTVVGCITNDCSQTVVLLDAYSGSLLPAPVTSSTGIMLLIWHSDTSNTRSGWSATWSAGGVTGISLSIFGPLIAKRWHLSPPPPPLRSLHLCPLVISVSSPHPLPHLPLISSLPFSLALSLNDYPSNLHSPSLGVPPGPLVHPLAPSVNESLAYSLPQSVNPSDSIRSLYHSLTHILFQVPSPLLQHSHPTQSSIGRQGLSPSLPPPPTTT